VFDYYTVIYIAYAFVLGVAIGYIGGLTGYVLKKQRIKKAKDNKDLV
jgi:hypothetical protein